MTIDDMYVRIFKALGHPIRMKIVRKLRNGPLCVCTMNEAVDFSQSNLSQHLKILKDAGILRSDKEGLKIMYSIKDEEVKNLLDIAEKIIKNEVDSMNDRLSAEE